MSENKKTTLEQDNLIAELVQTYDLSPDQIGFNGERLDPILDFEAICTMREKLTDFKAVDVSEVSYADGEAQAVCVIIKEQGKIITVSDFAQLGELMPDGSKVESSIQAKRLARARAMRSSIRAAGVNLMKAHKHFIETGETSVTVPIDVRATLTKEIHAIAGEIGFIVGDDRSEYVKHMAQMFGGRTSTKDLNDIELGQFRISLRAIRRVLQSTIAANIQKAA